VRRITTLHRREKVESREGESLRRDKWTPPKKREMGLREGEKSDGEQVRNHFKDLKLRKGGKGVQIT